MVTFLQKGGDFLFKPFWVQTAVFETFFFLFRVDQWMRQLFLTPLGLIRSLFKFIIQFLGKIFVSITSI